MIGKVFFKKQKRFYKVLKVTSCKRLVKSGELVEEDRCDIADYIISNGTVVELSRGLMWKSDLEKDFEPLSKNIFNTLKSSKINGLHKIDMWK